MPQSTFTVLNTTPDTVINNIVGILASGAAIYNKSLTEFQMDVIVNLGLTLISSNTNLGNPGPQGPIGLTGPVGPTPWAKGVIWTANTNYTSDPPASVVFYNNLAYVCINSHMSGSTFDGSNWVLAAVQGPKGNDGAQGIQGVQGPVPWANLEAYQSGHVYTNIAPVSVVTYNGAVYYCITAHTATVTFDGTKWLKALDSGPQGIQGNTGPVPFKSLTAWATNTAYSNVAPADYVSYNGSSFVCISPHTSTSTFDGTKWGLVASKGDQGPQGIQGTKGDTGPSSWKTPVPWMTNTSYTNIAPADTVTINGSSYVCIIAHTSGSTFDGSKFQLIASKGDPADPSLVDDAIYIALTRG